MNSATRRSRTGPGLTTKDLQGLILGYLQHHPASTFVELCRDVPGFAGDQTMGTALANLILWKGVSRQAVEALSLLEKSRRVRFEVTTFHAYGQPGRELGLPVAMQLKAHAEPHWLPVLVHGRKRRSIVQRYVPPVINQPPPKVFACPRCQSRAYEELPGGAGENGTLYRCVKCGFASTESAMFRGERP